MKKRFGFVILITILFASCSKYHYVGNIKSGGYTNGETENIMIHKSSVINYDVDGETFLCYNNDSLKSNTIDLTFYSKEKAKFNPVWLLAVPIVPFYLFIQLFNKQEYAEATVEKHFYKNKNRYKTKYKTDDFRNKVLKVQLLMKIEIKCKRDQINDTITIHDNMPLGIKLDSYIVKKKNDNISEILHDVKLVDGKEYHTYKIIGQNNVFSKRKTKVIIIQDVSVTTLDKYFYDYEFN